VLTHALLQEYPGELAESVRAHRTPHSMQVSADHCAGFVEILTPVQIIGSVSVSVTDLALNPNLFVKFLRESTLICLILVLLLGL
jgi:hypothetical protein